MTQPHRPWYTVLYIQVLLAIAAGVLIGHYFPHVGVTLRPLGDGFIALIKMMIAPVIFCTVVRGIGSMRDLKKVGRVGLKTLFYFEAVSTLALAIGLLVGEVLQPGKGFNIDPSTLDPHAVESYVHRAAEEGIVAHLMAIIPDTFMGAFARGDLLQVLLISILTGFAVARLGELGERINSVIDVLGNIFFGVIRIIVRAAPIGAFGAMAFTVGAFGVEFSRQSGRADRDLLSHQRVVRTDRARDHRASFRLLHFALHRLYQRRIADRARYQLVGDGAAANDSEDGAGRSVEASRGSGDSDRL